MSRFYGSLLGIAVREGKVPYRVYFNSQSRSRIASV